MAEIHWWGAPRHIGSLTQLSPRLDELFTPGVPIFESSQKMTASLRGVMVRHPALDKNGKNDLIVVTTNQFGDSAPTPRLHFMKDSVPIGWQGAFFDDTIVAVNDLRPGWRKLTVRVQVYDLDRIPVDLFTAVGTLAATGVGVAQPQLFAFAGAASAVVGPLVKLINNLNQHDEIIDQRVALELSEQGHGDMLLQPGYYVCFAQPVEESKPLSINHQLRVLEQGVEFTACGYSVLEIEPSFTIDRTHELDQDAARLVAELDGKNVDSSAIEALRSVVDAADKFRRLERAWQLASKNPAELTVSDQELLANLKLDPELAPFLHALG
ncbi:MAG: hypothetical protein M9936_09370 [Caldilinea sp.]|nr:hypothetical protein [Caldilinea sp.]MCB9116741.1 hypothetical protein [Caldilineaceae bacterium]MCB0050186.1 hypothetical protein [Caldilinea sp.]MCB9121097.1 hypothetical protein [Caldilineaceae bacterium]MCB9124724.1 hypothetical protein [Caldilineaceae bacterium]